MSTQRFTGATRPHLEVMDAYFAPQLAPNVSVLIRPQEGGTEGSALTSILVDRRSGIVKALRVIGLGNRFSCDLYDTIQEQLQRPFSTGDYFGKIDQIQMTYSSDQLDLRKSGHDRRRSGGNSLREGQIWTRNGAGRRNTIAFMYGGS